MKNNQIFKTVLALVILLGFVSCSDRDLVQVDSSAPPIIMDLSTENIFLDQNYPENPALTITWDQAKYTVPVEVIYKVEAAGTTDFKTPYLLGTVPESQRTATYTVKQLNEASQAIGLAPGVQGKMYLRVTSYLVGNILSTTSNVTSVKITPYTVSYPDFYLVGAASYVGWNETAAQLLYKKDNMSYIYTYLQPEKFRFLGQQAWNPLNYSLDDPGIKAEYRYFKQWPATIAPETSEHENMIFSGTGGIYKISINATAAERVLKIDASPLGYDYPELYLVGSINNWDVANPLTMTKLDTGVFELTTNLPANAEFKIVGQKDWGSLEWGNILKNNNGNSGFLGPKDDDSNIVFAGNGGSYKITVNLKAGTYKIQ